MSAQPEEITQIPDELPLIPLRDLILVPNLVVPLFVGRERSIVALEEAMRGGHQVALVTQRQPETEDPGPEDMYEIGCVANVLQELKLPDGTAKALVEGVKRVRITSFLENDPYIKVKVEVIDEVGTADVETQALMRALVTDFEKAAELGKPIPQEVLMAAGSIEEPGRLADFIAFHLNLKVEEKQVILEAIEPKERLEKASAFLRKELEILELGSKIQSRVKEQMTKSQREYFLREQLKAIQQELGMPEEVEEKALKELGRFEKMPQAAAESSVIRTYLDWLVGLPWTAMDEEKLDLLEAKRILDEDHYGLDKVKERVLEYLAVHKLTDKMRGPILCFVGPPGTGKTSIGKSIARSLGRKFIRMSLGGVRDEAEIRGHRRTYVGALPGRIIQSISQAKTRNPVFMMDEVDKVGADFRGDPTSALLEVLDPEQNNSFQDHYLEAPFDLSDTMFITTANLLDTIPAALQDRMEVIHFPGYTEDEKLNIARQYLVPKQVAEHGLTGGKLSVEDSALHEMQAGRAQGCRGLQGQDRRDRPDVTQVSRAAPVPLRHGGGEGRGRDRDGTRLDRSGRRRHLHRGHDHERQGRAHPDRAVGRRDARVGPGSSLIYTCARRFSRDRGRLPRQARRAHPRACGRHPEGRAFGGDHHGHRARVRARGLSRAPRGRDDGRDHPPRARPADRRPQGEAPRGSSRGHQDGPHPEGQRA
jgi:ATP-dependent Lon protease